MKDNAIYLLLSLFLSTIRCFLSLFYTLHLIFGVCLLFSFPVFFPFILLLFCIVRTVNAPHFRISLHVIRLQAINCVLHNWIQTNRFFLWIWPRNADITCIEIVRSENMQQKTKHTEKRQRGRKIGKESSQMSSSVVQNIFAIVYKKVGNERRNTGNRE